MSIGVLEPFVFCYKSFEGYKRKYQLTAQKGYVIDVIVIFVLKCRFLITGWIFW